MEIKIEKAENGYIIYSYRDSNDWKEQEDVIRVAYTFDEVVAMLKQEFNVVSI
jgi:hypothetical protein